jgi:Flp pilus assembly protein TadG
MKLRWMGSDRGTSVVEFALVAPVFIFMLIGLIETGRYTYYAILAAHAARAGVQYGAQSVFTAADSTGMRNAALQDGQNLPNWVITTSHFCENNGAAAGCPSGEPSAGTAYYVQVQVTGTFTSLIGYPGITNSLPIGATATLRVGGQ